MDQDALIALGSKIRQESVRQRMSQKALASLSGCDGKTIRNVLDGKKARPTTVSKICSVLKIDVPQSDSPGLSSEEHGGYPKSHIDDYLGFFFAVRRSYQDPKNLVRSVVEFRWDEKRSCMTFDERHASADYHQHGDVYMSPDIGLLHLLTKFKGALRLITLTKLRGLALRGTVLTQYPGDFYYQPAVSPIFFQKLSPSLQTVDQSLDREIGALAAAGPIKPGEPEYELFNRELTRIEDRITIFALAIDESDEQVKDIAVAGLRSISTNGDTQSSDRLAG